MVWLCGQRTELLLPHTVGASLKQPAAGDTLELNAMIQAGTWNT